MAALAEVSEEVKSTFAELRACQAREDRNRYIIYKLEKMIDVEKIGPNAASYDDFLNDLTGSGECRYGLFNYEYEMNGEDVAKLVFILWKPDSAKMMEKMIYYSSFEKIQEALIGVGKYIEATDLSECTVEVVDEKVRATGAGKPVDNPFSDLDFSHWKS